jgi:gluconokinase
VTRAIVVMGVAGAGKSTLGRALAAALGVSFVEGDTLHPPANVAKMAAGIPLDDADRRPFLEAVGSELARGRERGVVATCSALKRRYRDTLRAYAADALFVLPELSREALAERLATRRGHYMPASLLDSQLAILERPSEDERALVVDGTAPTERQVTAVLAALRGATNTPRGTSS